ncbi:hypothetical protein GCM10010121_085930 [Streptomyces brasiliensis]|uniref:Uncharacterized protein n=1 Tax=Streptomyces brasiliensis TaxID=1954 RepID=A0A917P561_9ACTN|nr:hypothetical protein GCM10010121_085930 [Streptomyces brasiliensis]
MRIWIWWSSREGKDLPRSRDLLINPHDVEARCGGKRGMVWDGYKVKTCEDDLPHLVVNVATIHAAVDDSRLIDSVHENLQRRGTKPGEHLVDAGCARSAASAAATPLPPAGADRADEPSWTHEAHCALIHPKLRSYPPLFRFRVVDHEATGTDRSAQTRRAPPRRHRARAGSDLPGPGPR